MSYSWLPALLAEIAEVAGLDAALAIAKAKGGTRASFPTPERLTRDHWLVEAVGIETARTICEHFKVRNTGLQLSIPLGPQGGYREQQRTRARALQAAITDNCSIDEAARLVGVDRSTVIRAKQRLRKAEGNQGSFNF
jgi:transcriptional regulator of acetoin/glycerol metabolism